MVKSNIKNLQIYYRIDHYRLYYQIIKIIKSNNKKKVKYNIGDNKQTYKVLLYNLIQKKIS